MPTPEHVLVVDHLSKTFPGQRALSDVALDVRAGEIHAVVGENGSGKSTLIKCLSGFHEPDPGARIAVRGVDLPVPYTAAEATRSGMAFIHQDLGLVPTLTVLENLALGHGFATGAARHIKWGVEEEAARDLLSAFGAHISPRALVSSLSQADKTLVAIARGLRNAQAGGLLVLDEPTAALPAEEVGALFEALERITATGVGIIYISHRLAEIFQVAARVTVLRDGSKVGTFDVADLDQSTLVGKIIGRSLQSYYPPATDTAREDVLLRARGLAANRLRGIDLDIHRGEIVGVAGLLGAGRSELGRVLFGAQPAAGTVELDGKVVALEDPAAAIAAGIALIPEDRRGAGAHLEMTLRENLVMGDAYRHWRHGRVDRRAERAEVDELIARFNIRPPFPERRFSAFSGGNQQKAIIAKWMRLDPRLLILDEPVQGVDIGSKTEIYGLIDEAASRGAAVLLIDSEFEDLCRLSDRVLVIADGVIVHELTGAERTRERIFALVHHSEGAA